MSHASWGIEAALTVALMLSARSASDPLLIKQAIVDAKPDTVMIDVSADGRFVAFESRAALSPADHNGLLDIYVADRACGTITLESRSLSGGAGNGDSRHPALSADGRHLVFESAASDLAGAPTSTGLLQVFLSDRVAGTIRLISRSRDGRPGNRSSRTPDISDDGRVIVFASGATDLVAEGDANGMLPDIYRLDVAGQTLTRISVTSAGQQPAAGGSATPRISGDGRVVAFMSKAALTSEVHAGTRLREVERRPHVFLRDLQTNATRLVSRTMNGQPAGGASWRPVITTDGRFVAYVSNAANLVRPDRNSSSDVFFFDSQSSTTTLVSRTPRGGSASGSSNHPAIAGRGRFIAFVSDADDLRCVRGDCPPALLDLNLLPDIYLFDTLTRTVKRVSESSASQSWWEASVGPALDASGDVIAFSSRHPSEPDDASYDYDLFVPPVVSQMAWDCAR